MCRIRSNDVGASYTLFNTSLTISETGHSNGLSASRCKNTASIFIAIIHVAEHANDFGLGLRDKLVLLLVKRVGLYVSTHDFVDKVPMVLIVNVDGATLFVFEPCVSALDLLILDELHQLVVGHGEHRKFFNRVLSLLRILIIKNIGKLLSFFVSLRLDGRDQLRHSENQSFDSQFTPLAVKCEQVVQHIHGDNSVKHSLGYAEATTTQCKAKRQYDI